ncbi:acyl carrier protein [compost metagenome]
MIKQGVTEQIIQIIEQKISSSSGSSFEDVNITADTLLRDVWFRLESIQVVEFVVELETSYEIALPDELLGQIDRSSMKVSDLAAIIEGEEG